MKLVIGGKNYSTWSLRPWLLMTAFGIEFEEITVSLKHEYAAKSLQDRLLGQYSPTYKVPVLVDEELTVWDSLAICEYISEQYLQGKGWPEDIQQRAQARMLCAEMHAGFSHLRNELPMNCRASRQLEFSEGVLREIARIDQMWANQCQQRSDQDDPADSQHWLFDTFSIADCFYAPVALRFKTYQVPLSQDAAQYQARLLAHAAVKAWVAAAMQETEVLEFCEVGK